MEYLYDNVITSKILLNTYDDNYLEYLVKIYGNDSLNYLSFEKDRKIFLSENIDGFIAYVIVNKVALCIGDPICASNDKKEFIIQFIKYCKSIRVKVCFSSITNEISEILKSLNFVVSKYGEEAILELENYEMTGKKTLKLRQKFNRAEKAGLKVIEYNPRAFKDIILEDKIADVSEEWFKAKKGQLTFSMGEMHLDDPLDRRYFISLNELDEVQAILMFSPYNQGKDYFLDVMRRRIDSIPGAMEHAIISASMKMKAESIRSVSLGIAPLAGINTKNHKSTSLEKCMSYIYTNVKCDYEFQKLFDYKKKFAPTNWVERYVAYDKGISLMRIGYVMIKAKNGNSVFKSVLGGILKKT